MGRRREGRRKEGKRGGEGSVSGRFSEILAPG